jgi:transcriptional regulator with XRE-family HTH domain
MEKNLLGKAIREQRKKIKITAESLAEKIGVDRTYISKIENKGWLPSSKTMQKIASTLKSSDLLRIFSFAKYPEIAKHLAKTYTYGTKHDKPTSIAMDIFLASVGDLMESNKSEKEIADFILRKILKIENINLEKKISKTLKEVKTLITEISRNYKDIK